jgi:type IV pilus assembly protein PilZ
MSKPGLLTLTIKDKSALHLAYMPYVINGGLFMKGAQGKRTAGIGVQFSDQDQGNTQKKIENYLAGALGGDKLTHTM